MIGRQAEKDVCYEPQVDDWEVSGNTTSSAREHLKAINNIKQFGAGPLWIDLEQNAISFMTKNISRIP
jgi:hypothetical protein